VDIQGNAYVTGNTHSSNFPTTASAFQRDFGGGSDAYVTKLNPAGTGLVYSSYLGGSGEDWGSGIALDSNANAYVAGYTASINFPTANAFQAAHAGGPINSNGDGPYDAFVAKVSELASRFEQDAATYSGPWTSYGAEQGTFSGGTMVASNVAGAAGTFSFTGTGVSWIGVKCNVCGIATVSIDGGLPTVVDTFGPAAPGSLTSEAVFSVSGLAAGDHTIAITVTGVSTAPATLIPRGVNVAVDAFDTTQ
jgi:hypothetical protein